MRTAIALGAGLLLLSVSCRDDGSQDQTPVTEPTITFSPSVEVTPIAASPVPLSSPVSTTPPPGLPGGRIAFVSSRDGNDEIYVMNSDGSNLTNLTNNSAADTDPDWSPDGSKIVFASDRDGDPELYIMNADGSDVRKLTDNQAEDLSPKWSPDGSRIAFYSTRSAALLWVMNADGSGPLPIVGGETVPEEPLCAKGGFPGGWSRDGSRIIFHIATLRPTPGGGPASVAGQICSAGLDGSDLQVLASQPPGFDVESKPSPSGDKLLFRSSRDGNDEVYVMEFDGSGQNRLTNDPNPDVHPNWSPGGDWIVFVSSREGNLEVYVMELDGSSLTRLTTSPADDIRPDWGP